MLSLEQRKALVAVFLSRMGRVLSELTRRPLEQYLVIRRILGVASAFKYFILPYPVGRIGVPKVTPDDAPDGMGTEDARTFRNLSSAHKTATYVVYEVRRRGLKNKKAEKGSEEEKILEALTIMISKFLLLEENGEERKLTSWAHVWDFLSTPRRDMEKLILQLPPGPARENALKALKLPEKKARKATPKKKSEDVPTGEEATNEEEQEPKSQPAKRKRNAANVARQPQKKARKAKNRSKASAGNDDADGAEVTSTQDDSYATDGGDASHPVRDPLLPIFNFDFNPGRAHRMDTPSKRLLCGLVALVDSIRHQQRQPIPIPTVAQLEAVRTALGIIDTGDFNEMQLGRILYAWGRTHGHVLQLGYVVGTAYHLHGVGEQVAERATRIWIHKDNAQQWYDNVINHWSGYRRENNEDDDAEMEL